MNELALFAGSGGGILGGRLLGWRTVCAVEIDAYATSVLIARQNDGILPPFPIWDDVRTFDGKPWHGIIDVVSGGFPCQDISCAGRGGGISGERSGLWKEMARIIGEVRPRYVLVENSPILTSRGLGVVLGDLAALGYDAEWGVLGAIDAGAPHLRNRIWIIAYTVSKQLRDESRWGSRQSWPSSPKPQYNGETCNVAHDQSARRFGMAMERESFKENTDVIGQDTHVSHSESLTVRPGLCQDESAGKRRRRSGNGDSAGEFSHTNTKHENNSGYGTGTVRRHRYPEAEISGGIPDADYSMFEKQCGAEPAQETCAAAGCSSWWLTEPDVGRVANGVAARVDRLKALGEGQVPAVVRIAWEVLNARM